MSIVLQAKVKAWVWKAEDSLKEFFPSFQQGLQAWNSSLGGKHHDQMIHLGLQQF